MTPGEHALLAGRASILAIRPPQIVPRQNATLTTKGSDILDSRLRDPSGVARGMLRVFVVKTVFSSLVAVLPCRVSVVKRNSNILPRRRRGRKESNPNFEIRISKFSNIFGKTETKNMVFQNQIDFKKRIGDEI